MEGLQKKKKEEAKEGKKDVLSLWMHRGIACQGTFLW